MNSIMDSIATDIPQQVMIAALDAIPFKSGYFLKELIMHHWPLIPGCTYHYTPGASHYDTRSYDLYESSLLYRTGNPDECMGIKIVVDPSGAWYVKIGIDTHYCIIGVRPYEITGAYLFIEPDPYRDTVCHIPVWNDFDNTKNMDDDCIIQFRREKVLERIRLSTRGYSFRTWRAY